MTIERSQSDTDPWEICLMILSEEFYLDETAMEGSTASLIQPYGYAVRDRIKAARQERAAPARSDAESDLASFIPITGPGVDALENRKESDNGPSEEQVNADLRRALVPPPSEAGLQNELEMARFWNKLRAEDIINLGQEIGRQKVVLDWIESWVSNPVGAYSVSALDGLFGMTRDKIAALSPDPGTAP